MTLASDWLNFKKRLLAALPKHHLKNLISFAANKEGTNSQSLVCQINICGTIGNDDIDCETPAEDSDCSDGFTL